MIGNQEFTKVFRHEVNYWPNMVKIFSWTEKIFIHTCIYSIMYDPQITLSIPFSLLLSQPILP